MKKLIIIGFILIPTLLFSQSKDGEETPDFADFVYYSPSKDTLFLQRNNIDALWVRSLWDYPGIEEPKPVIIYHEDVPDLRSVRLYKDWYAKKP